MHENTNFVLGRAVGYGRRWIIDRVETWSKGVAESTWELMLPSSTFPSNPLADRGVLQPYRRLKTRILLYNSVAKGVGPHIQFLKEPGIIQL